MQSSPSDFAFNPDDEAASHFWYLPDTARTPGATTQWLTFRVCFDGVARAAAAGIAVLLRAHAIVGASGGLERISGRGIVLGGGAEVATTSPSVVPPSIGAVGAPGARIHSVWPDGNFVYAAAAARPGGLTDGCWYRVQVHASDARWIAMSVENDDCSEENLSWPTVQDRADASILDAATGVLIAVPRGSAEGWRVQFRDIRTGWF